MPIAREIERIEDILSAAEKVRLQPFPEIENGSFIVVRGHEIAFFCSIDSQKIQPFPVLSEILAPALRNVQAKTRFTYKPRLLCREIDIAPIGAAMSLVSEQTILRPRVKYAASYPFSGITPPTTHARSPL